MRAVGVLAYGPLMDRLPYALDRDEGERLEFGDAVILLRTTGERSGGAVTIWEELPPLLDTPLAVTPSCGKIRFTLLLPRRRIRLASAQAQARARTGRPKSALRVSNFGPDAL